MTSTGQVAGTLTAAEHPMLARVLTPESLELLLELDARFEARRQQLLADRAARQRALRAGELPDFPSRTARQRAAHWLVAPAPDDLVDRRVEITGPTDRKMMINAFNSGASVFMADCEDATSPTWDNVLTGQVNLQDASRRRLELSTPERRYRMAATTAVLTVRPRGWHLDERHVSVNGHPLSASLFDFGCHLVHNGAALIERGTGPYFYLPKLESHLEARLWDDVFSFAETYLGLPRGKIRATVLIETILAAFEMDEILFELRDHASGLNAGRWDYIFSVVKKLGHDRRFLLPDRAAVTMTVPFMRAYTELLVATCHHRGAHAIGGMAAFIPNRRKPEVTATALEQVAADKRREAADGFDGTWVAHPDLVATARTEFDVVLGDRPNQLSRRRDDVAVTADDLLAIDRTPGSVTRAGVARNVSVGIRYLHSWLSGVGAASIDDLMEDAATAEICRSQIWQWIRHNVRLEDGELVSADLVRTMAASVAREAAAASTDAERRIERARALFEEVALGEELTEFLTLPAYAALD